MASKPKFSEAGILEQYRIALDNVAYVLGWKFLYR
ncbi:hypothetical protein Cycma_0873 [Cyclobacterium marinum DSM 745]|uniref:Uncharacterized protein n=1 Tax=Cyclobacterium marinum (strain ATCC 25205 / DSM 745 / LMG 13164 / NCIMB 1802) TaxID=880070 RepID=G0J3K7_CYCMS|nr:hypothetical protein Cycma_0873 [Cyclobacterium marinum DSM 745]